MEGNPLSLMQWAELYEKPAGRRVARTVVSDGVDVSTVLLGLDHRFGGDGPPIIFETMVFGGPLDGEQDRYATRAEAEAGHAAMVARAIAAQPGAS